MLNSVYKYALDNRQRLLDSLEKGADKIIGKAKEKWNVFEPQYKDAPKMLGIDGSFNSEKYQGVDLWMATSVAAKPNGETVISIPNIGFERNAQPQDAMRRLEIEACVESIDITELVLMDGSLHSGLISGDSKSRNDLITLVKRNRERIIFVSKTSDVSFEFESMGAMVGDIYYYNKASKQSGFSKIFSKDGPHGGPSISSTYIRLAHSAPLIKIEMLGQVDDSDIKDLISKLYKQSISGYPNALWQAHNLCTITSSDVQKIAMVIGIQNIVGAREVLN